MGKGGVKGRRVKSAEKALLASLFFPGLGQLYLGRPKRSAVIIAAGLAFVVLTFFLIGFVLFPILWLYGIYDSYDVARKIEFNAMVEDSEGLG
jgi:TM2 domain-containing membrane protein YozV